MPIVIDDPAASSTPEIDKRKSKTSYQRTWCAKLNRQKLQSAREKDRKRKENEKRSCHQENIKTETKLQRKGEKQYFEPKLVCNQS